MNIIVSNKEKGKDSHCLSYFMTNKKTITKIELSEAQHLAVHKSTNALCMEITMLIAILETEIRAEFRGETRM